MNCSFFENVLSPSISINKGLNVKKMVFLLMMTLSATAFASTEFVDCFSMRGTGHELTLVVARQELRQVRVLSSGNRQRAFLPIRLNNQTTRAYSFYKLPGTSMILEVSNSILTDLRGIVRALDGSDTFSCN